MLDKTCQIGNRILGAGELLCSRLVDNPDNLELIFPAVAEVAFKALTSQVPENVASCKIWNKASWMLLQKETDCDTITVLQKISHSTTVCKGQGFRCLSMNPFLHFKGQ